MVRAQFDIERVKAVTAHFWAKRSELGGVDLALIDGTFVSEGCIFERPGVVAYQPTPDPRAPITEVLWRYPVCEIVRPRYAGEPHRFRVFITDPTWSGESIEHFVNEVWPFSVLHGHTSLPADTVSGPTVSLETSTSDNSGQLEASAVCVEIPFHDHGVTTEGRSLGTPPQGLIAAAYSDAMKRTGWIGRLPTPGGSQQRPHLAVRTWCIHLHFLAGERLDVAIKSFGLVDGVTPGDVPAQPTHEAAVKLLKARRPFVTQIPRIPPMAKQRRRQRLG